MSEGEDRSAAVADTSPGRALALLTLAPIATREADLGERREKEEREREEAAERARRREVQLEEALDRVPELLRPSRPAEPTDEGFDSERFMMTLWLIPVFLIFVGNWISDKTIFESGYPWGAMLLLPIGLAALNGFWPVLKTMPARERFRTALQEYEAAISAADYRDAERAEVRESFASDEPDPAPVGDVSPGDAEGAAVRVDGCYTAAGADYHYFIRFFDDGLVMTVTIAGTGDAEDSARSLMDWLAPSDHSNGFSRGNLTQEGERISFAATSEEGTIEYEGTVGAGGAELRLRSHSFINGNKEDRVWRFIAL